MSWVGLYSMTNGLSTTDLAVIMHHTNINNNTLFNIIIFMIRTFIWHTFGMQQMRQFNSHSSQREMFSVVFSI